MITENIAKAVLLDPLSSGCDELLILSAYATPQMASWILKTYADKAAALSVRLLVGMTSTDGISERVHMGFQKLHGRKYADSNVSFECSYIEDLPPSHANLYLWLKKGAPIQAYTGSAEFLQRILVTAKQKEIVCPCNPIAALQHYRQEQKHSIYCNHSEIENHIRIQAKHAILDADGQAESAEESNQSRVTLSLLTDKGTVAARSGLNWGQRDGRNPNEAYIRLPSHVAKSGFFPLEGNFSVDTDDGKYLLLRVEQQNNKAITTPESNALLGEYFRNRLSLPFGDLITRDNLETYGRTDVVFLKIDDETFYMDFSSPVSSGERE